MERIKIITSDNQTLFIDKSFQQFSEIFKKLVEKNEQGEIILDCPSDLVELVINFFEQNKHDSPVAISCPLSRETNFSKILDKKISAILDNLNLSKLQQLIVLCNQLQYQQLFEISCAYLANKLQYLEPSNIRSLFNIEQNLNKQQLTRIRWENEWLEQ